MIASWGWQKYKLRASYLRFNPLRNPTHFSPRQQGFTLVELAIVTVIIGLLTTTLFMSVTALMEQQRRKETIARMSLAENALLAFVGTYRRLPCPADGTVPSGTVGVGLEARDGNGDCTAPNTGVLPWASLGLGEADATDAWGARLTYRVATGGTGFTRADALNATQCDPAGSAAVAAAVGTKPVSCVTTCNHTNLANCTSSQNFLLNRGLDVVDEAGNLLLAKAAGTGAAYVLISPMAEGGGGYNSSGGLTVSNIAAGSHGETNNINGQAIPAAGFFHDSRILAGNNAGVAHFDDVLVHPSVMQLLTRAQLAPRAQ